MGPMGTFIRVAVAGPLAVALTIAFSFLAQDRIDTLKDERFEEELLYLPNERLLNHFTGGLSSVIADLLWIKTIQYAVKEFHNQDRKFTWLESMVNTVTRLDPYFAGAYQYGGMLLAGIGADDKALTLLERGVVNNPYNEKLPFEMAQIYLLNRKDEPESAAVATHYLSMVAERSEHPEAYINWIRRIQRAENLEGIGRDLWEDVLARTDDEFIRELAREKLLELTIKENVQALNAIVEQYTQREGGRPLSLAGLVEKGYLDRLPADPEQGRYFIAEDGVVYNTQLIDFEAEELRNAINRSLARFERSFGRFPESLDDYTAETNTPVPPYPGPGREWRYNPATGQVN